MANNFYGSAYMEHYEKKISDFTSRDWLVVILLGIFAISAVISPIIGHWGVMIIFLGLCSCMGEVILRVVFNKRNKVTLIFIVLGVLAIIAGVIVEAKLWGFLPYYVCICYMIIAFGVAVLCTVIKVRNAKKMKSYSISVEAECVMVDVRKVNLFRFDDLVKNPYNAPINSNTLVKPGFHYVVNGEEYYTESTVYYGDLNKGFEEGQRVTLKVNPNNPNEILPISADSVTANMAMVMGIFWYIAGIVGIVVTILMLNGVISF